MGTGPRAGVRRGGLAVVAAAALAVGACGVGDDGDGGRIAAAQGDATTTSAPATTGTSTGATAPAAEATTTSAPTTTTTTTTTAEHALAAVQAGVQAVVDAGTGRYHATLHLTAPGVDSTITYDGTWDTTARLVEVRMRITSPDEDAEITILNDGSGSLYLHQPEISGDPDRPWVRLDPADIEGAGAGGIGIPSAPGPGEPPTPLTTALSGTSATAEADGDGFRVVVSGADALVLGSSHAILGGLGAIDLDAVHAALPATVALDVALDGGGRLTTGAGDVAGVAVAVLEGSGELDDVTADQVTADYTEEIVELGEPVDLAVPDPSEVVDAGD